MDGGIGAFAGGFAKSFASSREQRRLRDLDLMRQQQAQAREERMQSQFREQQDFRVKQQEQVQEYRAGQRQLQEKQVQVQKKKLDLDIMSGMEKAFDPKVPKAQRQFILKQTFKTMEIDPKSQEAKDFMAMAGSLDDDALKETRKNLLTMMPGAAPGEISAWASAIVSGQVQMKDALEEFNKAKKAKQFESAMDGSGAEPAAGVPTNKVQSSRITSQTPMAQQGGDMAIPGMEQPASGEPTSGGKTAQELRDRAVALSEAGFTTEATVQAQLARDTEAGKKMELKEIMGPDNKGIWVTEAEAVGKETVGARPVKSPEEERLSAASKASVEQDYARVKPWLEDASVAKATGPVLDSMKIANKSGKFTTGSFSGIREGFTKTAELLGASKLVEEMTGLDIGNPAIAETMKTGSAQLGTLMADKLGRATNMQVGYIQEALPGLMKTQRGNEIAIDLLERANKRSLQIEALYDEYQDKYKGDLRPPGKPSFFSEADRLRRKPLVEDETELEKEIRAESKKGNAIDVEDIWKKAQGPESQDQIMIGEDKYEITDKFEYKDAKGKVTGSVPMIKLKDGKSYPYVTTPEEAAKLPPGTEIVRLDKLHGAVMGKTK